jgi:hypothetical protein
MLVQRGMAYAAIMCCTGEGITTTLAANAAERVDRIASNSGVRCSGC